MQLPSFGQEVSIHIVTNTADSNNKNLILNAIENHSNTHIEIHTPTYLGHPFLLTWSHLSIFRKLFELDQSITHYMYLEDDIYLTRKNIEYWLNGRNNMRDKNLIPGFMRYEKRKDSNEIYSSDVTKILHFEKLPRIKQSNNYFYLNLPEPYQGMYFLDRSLMSEHLQSQSSIPEGGSWGIREKAAAGLTFMNIPKGCFSRHFIGYNLKERSIDPDSLIHHLPNNYANGTNPEMKNYGSIKISDLIIPPNL